MNQLLEVLWEELNFDLELAWSIMDPKSKGWITFEEFNSALEKISFTGDGLLIFNGLDTAGQGRVWKHELDCLKLLTPDSFAHPETSPPVMEFKEWVEAKFKHPLEMLNSIGLTEKSGPMTPKNMVLKCSKLGFNGDAARLTQLLGRGHAVITCGDIQELLLGKCQGPRQSESYAGRKWAFTPPERMKTASNKNMDKPQWNNSVFDPAFLNSRLGVRERHYFCKPFERPLRDEILADLTLNRGYKFQVQGSKGELQGKDARSKAKQAVNGCEPILDADLKRMQEHVQKHAPHHPPVLHSVKEEANKVYEQAQAAAAAQKEKERQEAIARGEIVDPSPRVEDPKTSTPAAKASATPQVASAKSSAQPVAQKPQEPKASAAAPAAPKPAAAKPAAAKAVAAKKDKYNVRVYMLGGIGLVHDDEETEAPDLVCTCEVVGNEDTQIGSSLSRETVEGKEENYEEPGEINAVDMDDELEFAVMEDAEEEDDEEEEEILGICLLKASQFLPNGFKGKLEVMNEDEEHIPGHYVLVKVDVLGRAK